MKLRILPQLIFILALIAWMPWVNFGEHSQSQIATPTPLPEGNHGTLCVMPFNDVDRSGLREGGEEEIDLPVQILSIPDELVVAQGEPAEEYSYPCYDLPPGHYIATVDGGEEWIPTLRDTAPAEVQAWDVTFVEFPFYAAGSTLPTPAEKWLQENTWILGILISGGFLIGMVQFNYRIKRRQPQPSRGMQATVVGLITAAIYGLIASILTPLEQYDMPTIILCVPAMFLIFVVGGRSMLVVHSLGALFWFGVGSIVAYRTKRAVIIFAICFGIAFVLALLSFGMLLWLVSNIGF